MMPWYKVHLTTGRNDSYDSTQISICTTKRRETLSVHGDAHVLHHNSFPSNSQQNACVFYAYVMCLLLLMSSSNVSCFKINCSFKMNIIGLTFEGNLTCIIVNDMVSVGKVCNKRRPLIVVCLLVGMAVFDVE